ncbi:hypothetical protein [Leucobacter sp. wl10]|uniref:hypothetical protein n=1 Tax=Leucobacter sp. wl10 TaxID=2304677 RepID=UPI000E5AD0D2|nr:hypothetical protein [Leucobacter sp. wl10]RGE18814.1 hypothetical protein D1J51_13920 [Leucobacter sp. wl10]
MDTDRLRELAEASEKENVLIALDAVMRMRRELERQEAVLVRRARNAGESWVAIAAVLGVSKQAAHQKYGRGAREARRG